MTRQRDGSALRRRGKQGEQQPRQRVGIVAQDSQRADCLHKADGDKAALRCEGDPDVRFIQIAAQGDHRFCGKPDLALQHRGEIGQWPLAVLEREVAEDRQVFEGEIHMRGDRLEPNESGVDRFQHCAEPVSQTRRQ